MKTRKTNPAQPVDLPRLARRVLFGLLLLSIFVSSLAMTIELWAVHWILGAMCAQIPIGALYWAVDCCCATTKLMDAPTLTLESTHISAGIAYSHAVPQPEMARSHYKSDYQRYQAAWHAAHCQIENCEWCQILCDQGLVIACDECGHVHHTDWLGWSGEVDEEVRCAVWCHECKPNDEARNGPR